MAIQFIFNGETGLSVRNKLNQVISFVNSYPQVVPQDVQASGSIYSGSIWESFPGSYLLSGSIGATSGFTGSFSGSFTGDGIFEDLVATKSLTVTGPTVITGSLIVTDRITAQEFYTEFVTSSVIFDSGSTRFGNSLDDRHEYTGSLFVSGTLVDFTQTEVISGSIFSGSFVGDASGLTNLPGGTLTLSGSQGIGSLTVGSQSLVVTGSRYGLVTYVTSSLPFTGSNNIFLIQFDEHVKVGRLSVSSSADVTGSLTIQTYFTGSPFIISMSYNSNNPVPFHVNEEGVTVLGEFQNEPTPIPGGFMFSGSEFYLGYH